jgi:spore germination protein GerM
VLLYLPGENAIGFITETALTDGTPEHIVSLLVSENALPEGSSLLDFVINNDGSCQADMNAAYGQALGKGTSAEYQLLGCLVNTLLTYFDLEEITLTIEGETLETGHNVYDYPLRIFE